MGTPLHKAAGRRNALVRHLGRSDPRVAEADAALVETRLEESIRTALESVPPLSEAQRDRLADLLRGGQA